MKRRKPLLPRKKTPEELAEREECRKQLFARSQGYCERRTHPNCRRRVPLYGDVFRRGHAAHVIRKDKLPLEQQWNPDFCDYSCYECHIIAEHSQGIKSPNKERVAAAEEMARRK